MTLQLVMVLVLTVSTWFAINIIYQVVRKPTELFFPVSGTLYKSPTETWTSYEPIFRKHSTATVSARIAGGARAGRRLRQSHRAHVLALVVHAQAVDIYRPASSAVGMYQITDGTFEETSQLCIHDHKVVDDGPWNDFKSCWFNSLYLRVIPSHAVEMTSAYLDRRIALILAKNGIRSATVKQKQDLAAVIHVCGAGAGSAFARRGFRPRPGQHCGDHSVQGYIARVNRMKQVFAGLAQQPKASPWQ